MALISCSLDRTRAEETKTRKVAFLLWDGVELIEFAGPAQILHFAPGFEGYTIGESRKPIRSYFVTMVPQYTFEDYPQPDVVVVPAGVFMMKNEPLNRWLREVVPQAEAVLSVCNGSLILANAGVLDGHAATAPTGNLDDLRILGREVTPYINRRFVDSGKFVTADSYFAGVDAALYLVHKLAGPDAAQRAARRNLYDWQPDRFVNDATAPGIVPNSRRYEAISILLRDGLEAAVSAFAQMKESGTPAYTHPLNANNEENLFRYTFWNLLNANRLDDALKLARFNVKVFPDSDMAQACLGEALVFHTEFGQAAEVLIPLLTRQPGQGHARRWLKEALSSRSVPTSEIMRTARSLYRDQSTESTTVLIPDGEPGPPLIVSGVIRDTDKDPVAGALVYAYHTDARGYYSSDGMDEANPRLFGYMRTGANGRYDFRSIRPGHYPDVDEPVEQHVHFEVSAPGFALMVARLGFADDPFWTRHQKTPPWWARPVSNGVDGVDRVEFDIPVARNAPE